VIITKKAIPRRTVLRGIGATLALPLLDGMVPAFAAIRNTAAKPALRFGTVYAPTGMIMKFYRPATEGAGFEITRILEPLKPFRDNLLVVGGLCNPIANPRPGEGTGDHSRAGSAFLTSAHAKKTEGADMELGTSIDQYLAKEFGKYTQLPSLELSLSFNNMVGGCDPGYACPYTRTISWSSPNTPVPMETDPRVVFERLFGDVNSTDPAQRLARMQQQRSLLDSVTEEVTRLRKKLGPGDRTKLTEYLESIRDIERRIELAEEQNDRELPTVDQPTGGIPRRYDEHAKVMFDLQALALQSDLTRAFTFMFNHDGSDRAYPEIGVSDAHHPLTHNVIDPTAVEKVTKINVFMMNLFAQFVEKLRSTPDGDGTLLDHSILLYGSGLSNANVHSHDDLPILLVGNGGGRIKGGRYVRYENVRLANLHASLLNTLGVPVTQFGDSTGLLEGLS
jgi:uncharacterized protein DUF1552